MISSVNANTNGDFKKTKNIHFGEFDKTNKYTEKPEDTKFSALYFNDWHGNKNTYKTAGLASAADSFLKKNNDGFILSAGDSLIGGAAFKDLIPKNLFMLDFLNHLSEKVKKYSKTKDDGLMSAMGNHELDCGEKNLSKALQQAGFKIVATNFHSDETCPLKQNENTNIFKSVIAEKNGHYYGFIGALPTDVRKSSSGFFPGVNLGPFEKEALKSQQNFAELKEKNASDQNLVGQINTEEKKIDEAILKDTVSQLQAEVDALTGKGINKIIMLSHLGLEKEKYVAKNTRGIDVIIGGHSHDLVDGVQKDKNLLYNLDNEPVITTMAQKDGNYFGILNLVFDQKGVIKTDSIENKVQKTTEQPINEAEKSYVENLKENIFGKAEIMNQIDKDYNPENPHTKENPITNNLMDAIKRKVIMDAIKEKVFRKTNNTEIIKPEAVFYNSSNVRGGFRAPTITGEDIYEIIPFENKPSMALIPEKNIYAALQHGVDTTTEKPEMLQVSGIQYKIKDGKVTEAFLVDEEMKKTPINPDSTKEHLVITDPFLLRGGSGYNMLKIPENKVVKQYNWIIQDSMKEYLRSLTQNELQEKLKPQGRITFE